MEACLAGWLFTQCAFVSLAMVPLSVGIQHSLACVCSSSTPLPGKHETFSVRLGMPVACFSSLLLSLSVSPQGLLDLHLLAEACGVYKTPPAAVLEDELAKQARGIKTFNRREQWGLAGAHASWRLGVS